MSEAKMTSEFEAALGEFGAAYAKGPAERLHAAGKKITDLFLTSRTPLAGAGERGEEPVAYRWRLESDAKHGIGWTEWWDMSSHHQIPTHSKTEVEYAYARPTTPSIGGQEELVRRGEGWLELNDCEQGEQITIRLIRDLVAALKAVDEHLSTAESAATESTRPSAGP